MMKVFWKLWVHGARDFSKLQLGQKLRNSPVEMSQLRNSGAAPVLVDILSFHSNDLQTLAGKCGALRVQSSQMQWM